MEQFLDRNQKLLMVLAVLIIIGAAVYIVQQGIEKSRQETAGAALIKAEGLEDLAAVIKEHAGTHAAESATLLLADKQWSEDKKEEAIATLEAFIAEHPQHPAAATAKASLASKWMNQGKTPEAVELLEQITNDPQAAYLAPYALICIGDIASAAGDTTRAETSYKRISMDFPESQFAQTAESRLQTLKAKPPVEVEPPAPAPEPAPETSAPATPESAPTADPAPPATPGQP